jgi:hypothetical protein
MIFHLDAGERVDPCPIDGIGVALRIFAEIDCVAKELKDRPVFGEQTGRPRVRSAVAADSMRCRTALNAGQRFSLA